jgi:hypothetical protein
MRVVKEAKKVDVLVHSALTNESCTINGEC